MFNTQQVQQRFFPADKGRVFDALRNCVDSRFKLKCSDDFTLSVSFSSGLSLFTWGENFTAQVIPKDGGAMVEIVGVGKVGAQIQQSSRTNKLMTKLFEEISKSLRDDAETTQR